MIYTTCNHGAAPPFGWKGGLRRQARKEKLRNSETEKQNIQPHSIKLWNGMGKQNLCRIEGIAFLLRKGWGWALLFLKMFFSPCEYLNSLPSCPHCLSYKSEKQRNVKKSAQFEPAECINTWWLTWNICSLSVLCTSLNTQTRGVLVSYFYSNIWWCEQPGYQPPKSFILFLCSHGLSNRNMDAKTCELEGKQKLNPQTASLDFA